LNDSEGLKLIQKKIELNVREVRTLLRYFRKLRVVAGKEPPTKKKSLWERTKEEAKEELIEELKLQERGITLRPNGPYRTARKPSLSEQKRQQDQINHITEGKAEKKYRILDSKYDSKLEGQEKKAQKLVEKIDYTITAYKVAFAKYPEADKTLLLIDWENLRNKFSIKDIMKFEEQGLFDRTIYVLEIITSRLTQPRWERIMGKIGACFIQLYNVTLRAILDTKIK